MENRNTSKTTIILFFFLLIILTITGCLSNKEDKQRVSQLTATPSQPNILWLVTEDMGSYLPSFGDSTILTPNLSRLASEGIVYPNLFSTSGVCSPSRAAIALGMYPSSIGANHMRTTSYTEETGLPAYEALPPPQARMVSEFLRMNGYYCSNNNKQDYQFKAPVTAWDESGPYAHWRNRGKGQPFFAVFNFTETHESGLFEPYGHRHSETRHYKSGDRNYKWPSGRMSEEETKKHLSKNTKFDIPLYLPNNDITQRDMWKVYNNIAEMDQQVGAVLEQLEEDGLLENTIIFFYGDHGGPLPRQKRLIYDSGLNTPMIIRYPNKHKAGSKDEQLISFVDFAPTLLSIAEINPPSYMQGRAFLGRYKEQKGRNFVHAAADRFDAFTDAIRAVRDKQFKYIRNYRPDQGYYLPVAYRERIPTMQELLRLRDEGKLDSIQALWFRESKEEEELYDCIADPHEINNLARNPAYTANLEELRTEMDRWLEQIEDQVNLPEKELIANLWDGEETQPMTLEPSITLSEGKVFIKSETQGASLGYQIVPSNGIEDKVWSVYKEPILVPKGALLLAQAHRIGFKPSKIVESK